MTAKPYRDPDWLREQYEDFDRSEREIAEFADVDPATIHRWMKKHDIETRPSGSRNFDYDRAKQTYHNESWLRRKYWDEKKTLKEIAKEADSSVTSIRRWLDRYGIERRNQSNTPACYYTTKRGYELWDLPSLDNSKVVGVHQVLAIAEGADPHKIFSGGTYQVHHLNGIPWGNWPGNIEVLTASEHSKLH